MESFKIITVFIFTSCFINFSLGLTQQYGTTVLATKKSEPDTSYGPPGASILAKKSEPDTSYGPPKFSPKGSQKMELDTNYGPPGFTPGEPIDYLTYKSNGGAKGKRSSGCKNTDPNINKQVVMTFYQEALGNKNADAAKMLAPDYINHSPYSSGPGREDFVKLLKGPFTAAPSQKIDFKRTIADGDMVWTHSSWELGGKKYAAADIFQINCDGLIQEHWDVLQDTSVPTMNPHPFF